MRPGAAMRDKGGPSTARRQYHKQQGRRSKAEADEIADIEQALAEGAPPRGSNPLAAAAAAGSEAPPGLAAAKKFEDLPISGYSKQGLRDAKYITLTAVQRAALPHALCGRDVLGAAKTGSGEWGRGGVQRCSSTFVCTFAAVLAAAGRCPRPQGTARLQILVPRPASRFPCLPPAFPFHAPRLSAPLPPSGKTLAFLLPALEALYRQRWSRLDGLGALIISPTRELALQVGVPLLMPLFSALVHMCGACRRGGGLWGCQRRRCRGRPGCGAVGRVGAG